MHLTNIQFDFQMTIVRLKYQYTYWITVTAGKFLASQQIYDIDSICFQCNVVEVKNLFTVPVYSLKVKVDRNVFRILIDNIFRMKARTYYAVCTTKFPLVAKEWQQVLQEHGFIPVQ